MRRPTEPVSTPKTMAEEKVEALKERKPKINGQNPDKNTRFVGKVGVVGGSVRSRFFLSN